MDSLSDTLRLATMDKLRKFEQIRGKPAHSFPFPFWDAVVISAADEAQSFAFQQQIDEKVKNKELPLDVRFFCFPDPGPDKIGPGGSLMAVSFLLQQFYGQTFDNTKVLFIPAGGFSQRLPSASMLGKIFTTLPLGNPIYQMLEMQLAMYIDMPSRMKAGIFLACADIFILYDADDSSQWTFDQQGITAFAHPSDLETGRNHGVFVLPQSDLKPAKISLVECERFLHKVNPEVMRINGAVLPKAWSPGSESILIDSSYFIDCQTIGKLIKFYSKVQPLRCEIDSHGDFLQALGTKSDSSYITNTQNVVTQSHSLLQMRKDIFNALQGTPLNALVLRDSKFYHIGTTKEYLYHFCQNRALQYELGLQNDVCNRYTGGMVGDFTEPDACCIISCSLPSSVNISENVVLEFCRFEGNIRIATDCIISNCSYNSASSDVITIPANVFLHTVCVKHHDKCQYVTVVFSTDDNLKKAHDQNNAGKLVFLGKTLHETFLGSSTEPSHLFETDEMKCSLWNAKLFQPQSSMEDAFGHALKMIKVIRGQELSEVKDLFKHGISMKVILNQKNIEGMLTFRRNLVASIHQ